MKARSAAVGALLILAIAVAGCTSERVYPTPPEHVQFPARTGPRIVVSNIMLAYEEMIAEGYLDCLSEDFVFYPAEEDANDPEVEIPPEWYKTTESDIHWNMFSEDSGVESISLAVTVMDSEFMTGNPVDPADDVWGYTLGVDLRVDLADSLHLVATSPCEIRMRIDQDQQGLDGEALWEIYGWYDLGGRGESPGQEMSWGRIKARFRDS
jgi:hypothetical protein